MSIRIAHRTIDAGHRPAWTLPETAAIWHTCIRDVAFFDSAPETLPKDAEWLDGGDAYAFLLETICGLRSPMLGETQVLGQFRSFLGSLEPADASWLGPVGQQLMNDARAIRERHLRGLGSRSYGSAVRRHLDDAVTVAVIGAGALASEILPYVSDTASVDRWTRASIADAAERPISGAPTVLLIAAPVSAADIARVAARYSRLLRVIDMRGASERDALALETAIVTLDDLFADVEASAAAGAERAAAARAEIRRLAAAYEQRHQLRPFGWDDLCA